MRKCLLFVALLIVSQFTTVNAQGLFNAPDTVCIKQPIQLTSNALYPQTNYWGFCSGYLLNNPIGSNLGLSFGFQLPSDINVERDETGYYGFVTNALTSELIRLNFGNSLANTPTITNLGTLDNKMPVSPNALYIVKDSVQNHWHVFVVGGTDATNSALVRVDFGNSLGFNTPNIANMGNVRNVFNAPTGLFIQKQGPNYYGWCVNAADNTLVYIDFSDNISYTPIPQNLGILGGVFNQPSDLAGVYDGTNWFLFVTNQFDNTVSRVDLGSNVYNTTPTAVNIGNPDSKLFGPTSITTSRDCDNVYLFITNGTTNELVRVTMPTAFGPYTGFNYGTSLAPAAFNGPTGLSKIIRDREADNIYAFITNNDATLSRVQFLECDNSSVQSSQSFIPPVYAYDTPGLYNVYYIVDEGLSTMQIECKQIRALKIPDIDISNDTAICQGDTITIQSISAAADTIRWSPPFHISDTTTFIVDVWPSYTTTYGINLIYPTGCIVDTSITVTVKKIQADAGPDRELSDGAKTVLGGPYTSPAGDSAFAYIWHPGQYLDDSTAAYPVATPLHSITYYLEVIALNDTLQCTAIDTVSVKVTCGELNLPNAFNPASTNPLSNRFGLLNKQVAKLTYLRIWDRWGKLVFESTDPTKQWDGNVEGKPAPFGVYVWEADGFCIGGLRVKKQGNVTLIR